MEYIYFLILVLTALNWIQLYISFCQRKKIKILIGKIISHVALIKKQIENEDSFTYYGIIRDDQVPSSAIDKVKEYFDSELVERINCDYKKQREVK